MRGEPGPRMRTPSQHVALGSRIFAGANSGMTAMPDIRTTLIANRGEIACRIRRTAKAMGYRTAAVYSEADADALHVRQADAAACIGPPEARASYLNAPAIIAAAK